MACEMRKRAKKIFMFIMIILCWLCNVSAEHLDISECGHPVVSQYTDGELEWTWVVKPGEYEECLFLGEGYIAVKKKNGRYGIIDQSGKPVFPDEYDEIEEYCEGLARVCNREKVFFIDRNGKRIADRNYQDAHHFHEGKAAVMPDKDLWGFINSRGDEVIGCRFCAVNDFSEGLAAVQIKDQWGFINEKGEMIIPCRYDEVRNFKEGFAAVRWKEQWGFIDRNGKMITTVQFDEVRDFSESYAAVRQEEQWGFIDCEGRTVIALMYDAAGDFSEGKAAVKINDYFEGCIDAWAYIDQNNKVVIDYDSYTASEGRMEYLGSFRNGIAFVSDVFYSIIDEKGRYIFDGQASQFIISSLEYNEKYDAIPGYIYVDDAMKIKKYGLVGLHGIQRLAPVFDYVHGIFDNYVLVSQKTYSGWGYGVIEIVE